MVQLNDDAIQFDDSVQFDDIVALRSERRARLDDTVYIFIFRIEEDDCATKNSCAIEHACATSRRICTTTDGDDGRCTEYIKRFNTNMCYTKK